MFETSRLRDALSFAATAYEVHEDHRLMEDSVGELCSKFGEDYWQGLEPEEAYPYEFVDALTKAGWLSLTIPAEYGGGGGFLRDACVVLQTINRYGGLSTALFGQFFTTETLLAFGSEEQKRCYLPAISAGDLRFQAFAVTEPDAGSNTLAISTTATASGNGYRVNGTKVFISRVEQSDLLLLLARTGQPSEGGRKGEGLSTFIVDLREAGSALSVRRIHTMTSHHAYELTFKDLELPREALVGVEGQGFYQILTSMNSERVLFASQLIGDALWFLGRAVEYGTERQVFGRPLAANQALQLPIARAYVNVMAAGKIRWDAAVRYEAGQAAGAEANAAKLLASEANWQAANAAMDIFGGYGLAREFGIERKFREARLPLVAPVGNNLVLSYVGNQVLGMPKSY